MTDRLCSVAACERRTRTRSADLCALHYHRLYMLGSLEGGEPRACRTCPTVFTEPAMRGYVNPFCLACREVYRECERCDVLLRRDSERRTMRCQRCERDRQLLSKYGITLDELETWIEAQDHGCAICRHPIDVATGHVDHDHSCCPGQRTCGGCLRGILCGGCNNGIGYMREDVEALLSAADYLRGHAVRPIAS